MAWNAQHDYHTFKLSIKTLFSSCLKMSPCWRPLTASENFKDSCIIISFLLQDVHLEADFTLWRTHGIQIWGSLLVSCTVSSATANLWVSSNSHFGLHLCGSTDQWDSREGVVNQTDASVSPLQQKSRRGKVFGRVNCKNIKQDCPSLDCDDPILLPGHCCKTCHKGKSLLTHSHHWLVSKKTNLIKIQ